MIALLSGKAGLCRLRRPTYSLVKDTDKAMIGENYFAQSKYDTDKEI
jgi:hypothetical protein